MPLALAVLDHRKDALRGANKDPLALAVGQVLGHLQVQQD